MIRNYNRELKDNAERKYKYDFDEVLRGYMMQSFAAFFQGGKALEMGCYDGEMTVHLADYFTKLEVVEAAKDSIKKAETRLKKAKKSAVFHHSLFENFTPRQKYDAIFLVHTLEHLDNPVNVLKRAKSWLSKEGLLFIACPNANAPSRQIAVKMGLISHNSAVTPGEREHGHRITYALDTLERDVTDAGLAITHRGGVFFKALANFQFDKLMQTDIINQAYLDGCYELGQLYPDLCASIYIICKR